MHGCLTRTQMETRFSPSSCMFITWKLVKVLSYLCFKTEKAEKREHLLLELQSLNLPNRKFHPPAFLI